MWEIFKLVAISSRWELDLRCIFLCIVGILVNVDTRLWNLNVLKL